MRRGSVVGPLILILIGALFLLNNIRPDLSLIGMMAQYWPYLLIAWGVLRLVEILFLFGRSRSTPVAGVSGGEWVLIVFLCIFGTGLYSFRNQVGHWRAGNVRLPVLEVFGEPFDYPINEQRVPQNKAGRLLVENFRGNARIVGADVTEVKVTGRKTIRALNTESASKADSITPIEVVAQGDLIVVRTNQERAQGENRVSADLEITVPKGMSVECRGRYGDFEVNDLTGNVEVVSDNAGVRVQNIGGTVRADLRRSDIIRAVNVKGQVQLKGRWNNIELENIEGQVIMQGNYSGDVQFRNVAKPIRFEGDQTQFNIERCPGEVRMARGYFNGNNLVGPIRINSRSKDIQISDFTQGLEISIDRGDIELRPAGIGRMDIRTRSGAIDIALPASARFQLRAEVNKGDVTNDFGDILKVNNEGRGGTIHGGADGPQITLNTDRGSITVRKSSGETGPIPARSTVPVEAEPVPPPDAEKPLAHPPKAPKVPKLKVEVN
jgi:DUF4097 and DUF4098 domain-containing protein YvlB